MVCMDILYTYAILYTNSFFNVTLNLNSKQQSHKLINGNRRFKVTATGPGGEIIEADYTELELRQTIADSLARGINASCAIEGEGLRHPIKIDPASVPECLLTTD